MLIPFPRWMLELWEERQKLYRMVLMFQNIF